MGLFNKKENFSGGIDLLIVGLGNPGRKYDGTRHNTGFFIVDRIAENHSIKTDRLKFKSLTGSGTIGGKKVLLLKPSTFMNLSGQAVTEAMRFYKLKPEQVLIIFDDISLDVGKMRIRLKGSAGGHNGMKNIIYLSGSDNFPRIKVGIGAKPHPEYDLADWVLSHFTQNEVKLLEDVAEKAEKAAVLIAEGEADRAMNQFNS